MDDPQRVSGIGRLSPPVVHGLMVATVAVLVGVLYALVSGPPGNGPQGTPFTVAVSRDATNWTVTFREVPSDRLPSELFLLVRNGSGAIVLPRTSFGELTAGNWSLNGALYVDSNPSAMDVQAGDGLRLDVTRYPTGSAIEASDRGALLLIEFLR